MGLEVAFEDPDDHGRQEGPGQADEQPGKPVTQAGGDGLLGGPPGRRDVVEEAAQPGDVLVVLGEENLEQSGRRHEPQERPVAVDHGQASLAALRRPPGCLLAVDARRDDGWVVVHEVADPVVRAGGEEPFDRQESDEPVPLAHRDLLGTIEAHAAEAGSQGAGHLAWRRPGHPVDHMSGDGFGAKALPGEGTIGPRIDGGHPAGAGAGSGAGRRRERAMPENQRALALGVRRWVA